MGKPTICIGENKGEDQFRGNRKADQRLSFRYTDSTTLTIFCDCTGWFVSDLVGTQIIVFLTHRLILHKKNVNNAL